MLPKVLVAVAALVVGLGAVGGQVPWLPKALVILYALAFLAFLMKRGWSSET